jgi:branched-chain amino acid transport system substrate-binding protein
VAAGAAWRGSSTLAVVFPVRSAAAVGLALLVVAGCSGGDDATPEPTVAATTSTVAPSREGDGQLKIGILLPTSDAVIGKPLIDAAELAIEKINEAGGVLGEQVLSVAADEGSTTAIASDSIQRLIAQNVDAIVGPSSSLITLATLGDIVSADVVDCSPTASALALDNFPDHELFFRTIPSDSLQAVAIAEQVQQSGAQTVAVVHVNDAYGRGLAQAVTSALEARRITVLDTLPFNGHDDDLVDDAGRVVALGARAAVVLADGLDGTSFVNALGQVDTSSLLRVIVNDAMRMPSSPQVIQALDPAFREKLLGVAPQAEPSADASFEPAGFYAVNAFDCVNLIALAAMQAGSDAPGDIAGQMANVSAGGASCRSFAECAATFAESLDFDYDGPSGVTELIVRQGDPKRAVFETFAFDETGRDQVVSTEVVEQ